MIDRLKALIENKFGKKISCQKDCKILSDSIMDVSREYSSPATLRRLFGLLVTNSQPSLVTLDILCRYVGFTDWEQFVELNRGKDSSDVFEAEKWDRVLAKSRMISMSTFESLKKRSGIPFNSTIDRHFLEERLNYFLYSSYSATALIGPGGYGKSIALAKWFEKAITKKTHSKDIIIFIQAISFNSITNSETFFEDWLMHQFGISAESNFLKNLTSQNASLPGRFILVIDSFDEANLTGAKLDKVYSLLTDFLLRFSAFPWFKVIVSSRLHDWNRFVPFIISNEKWYHIEQESISADGANIPLLSSNEIQLLFDNTINKNFTKLTLVDELSLELRETLSYPYFLQLFTAIFHPESQYLLNDQIEIFHEFLNKIIYNSIYSEEKIDIINKIIELSDYGLNPINVKKNSLKDVYPIHLKLAGNYYAAYEDLISFGIITEDEIVSKYGGYSKIVRITDSNLFEILIVRAFIEKDEEISISLFLQIQEKYFGHELLPKLIIRLYQFAYKNRLLQPLMSFFDLNPQTLEVVLKSPALAVALRKDDYLRKHLLPIYSSIPMARKYYFEDYPDFNYITGSFLVSLDYYLKHYDTDEEEIIGFILNVYSGFFSLDDGRIERYYSKLKDFTPNGNVKPNIAGKWFGCKLLYAYFLKNSKVDSIIEDAINYLKLIRLSDTYCYGAFESSFYSALVITNQYKVLSRLTKNDNPNQLPVSKDVLTLFGFVSKIHLGKPLELKDVIEIDIILSQLNPLDSFIYKILGQVLKAFYYLTSKEMTLAYDCFKYSIEISNLAGFKIIEVKLMKNLSASLLRLGEKTKSAECRLFAEQLTAKTGFQYDSF